MGGDSLRRLENTFRGDRILTIMTTVFGGGLLSIRVSQNPSNWTLDIYASCSTAP